MNKSINSNITDIALTVYKNIQNEQTINLNNVVKSSTISLGFNILKNMLTGQARKTSKTQKLLFLGGVAILSFNYMDKKQTLNY